MDLIGGIVVSSGERRRDQPFRVCIRDADGYTNEFWSNDPAEAAAVFAIKARRILRAVGAR